MASCIWCDGTGFVQVTGIMCRTCLGTGKVVSKRRSCVGMSSLNDDWPTAKHCIVCNRFVHDWKRNLSWGEFWKDPDPICANGCNWHPCESGAVCVAPYSGTTYADMLYWLLREWCDPENPYLSNPNPCGPSS